jgi:ABC-2 type transport system ATP-binding protein
MQRTPCARSAFTTRAVARSTTAACAAAVTRDGPPLSRVIPGTSLNARIEAPALTLRGLSRSFGEIVALAPVDLSVEPGARVALRGPNGSGKTTLLRCVAGTLTPSAGEAFVGPHRAGTGAARLLVGASLATERSFYLRLTGRANLEFFARLRHPDERSAQRQVDALVEELEIEDIVRRRLDGCSTGMCQQVALARALLGDPRVLLLDEPTRSLDADAVDRLWAALDRRPGAAALIATHRPEDIARCGGLVDLER